MFPSSNDAEFLNYVGCHASSGWAGGHRTIKVSHHHHHHRHHGMESWTGDGILETDRNQNNWICQSDPMEMPGSINLILVKANKFVSIDFSVSTRHIRAGKDGLELTNQADHVIKLHLELVTDHFFQNDEFLHQVFSVSGQTGQLRFPGTGHSALSWVICTKMC